MFTEEQLLKIQSCGYDSISREMTSISEIRENLDAEGSYYDNLIYNVSGRVMARNVVGKHLIFIRIEDRNDKIQLFIKKTEQNVEIFNKMKAVDLGDIVLASGKAGHSATGEFSLFVEGFMVTAKNILTMPDKVNGISDVETKRRQRYLDLLSDMDTRKKFAMRSKIIREIRRHFENAGFMEVETPMLHPIPGGANARPFKTHHNALDKDFYLRIAPELYLKRLLVGGFEAVFEINRSFRNEGISGKHNPEFTMIEFYQTYKDYNDLIHRIKRLFNHVLLFTQEKSTFVYNGNEIDMEKSRIIRYDDLLREAGVQDPWSLDCLEKFCLDKMVSIEKLPTTFGGYFDLIFSEFIESSIIQPTFVTHFPTEISPLAKCCSDDPRVTERFELYICGMEVANGFSELNNPAEQAKRFEDQVKDNHNNDEAMHFDADYINALSYGMPPAAGAGIGIDRLVMLLTDQQSIRDVILFPALR
jgi:lysyl-tRNA synthetase class 2